MRARLEAWLRRLLGFALLGGCLAASASLLTWSVADPSFIHTTDGSTRNALGAIGANFSDLAMRLFGLAAVLLILPPVFWGLQLITRRELEDARLKLVLAPAAVLLLASAVSALPRTGVWPLPYGLGGLLGDHTFRVLASLAASAAPERATLIAGVVSLVGGSMLLMASLGMSMQDLRLIGQVRLPRFQLIGVAWRKLVRALDRGGDRGYVRREPTFDMSPAFDMSPTFEARHGQFPPEPTFDAEPRLTAPGDGMAPPSKHVDLRKPVRDPEFDRSTEAGSRDMARRFAPARDDEHGGTSSAFGLLPRRGAGVRAAERSAGRVAQRGPVWPGSMPVPTEGGVAPAGRLPRVQVVGDELYGRAVAIVRAQRKASTEYLQQTLGIGYMRAADLIDRMEREGVVGAPIHNGQRPILSASPRARTV